MFLGNKLPRSDTRHVNSQTDEPLSHTFFHSYYSFDRSESSELLFTLILGSYYRKTKMLFQKRNMEHQ